MLFSLLGACQARGVGGERPENGRIRSKRHVTAWLDQGSSQPRRGWSGESHCAGGVLCCPRSVGSLGFYENPDDYLHHYEYSLW